MGLCESWEQLFILVGGSPLVFVTFSSSHHGSSLETTLQFLFLTALLIARDLFSWPTDESYYYYSQSVPKIENKMWDKSCAPLRAYITCKGLRSLLKWNTSQLYNCASYLPIIVRLSISYDWTDVMDHPGPFKDDAEFDLGSSRVDNESIVSWLQVVSSR